MRKALAFTIRFPRRCEKGTMRHKWATGGLLSLLILGAGPCPAFAGDVFYGKATAVKSAEVVVVDYGEGRYDIRLVGVVVPKEGPLAERAKEFVSNLVLGKVVRARFEGRAKNGEMVSRLFTGDPGVDVSVELLKAGLARRQPKYDYKYGELSAAEREAREAKRGVWAAAQPK
jgi:endonuclease YncB( thermonuclease family)